MEVGDIKYGGPTFSATPFNMDNIRIEGSINPDSNTTVLYVIAYLAKEKTSQAFQISSTQFPEISSSRFESSVQDYLTKRYDKAKRYKWMTYILCILGIIGAFYSSNIYIKYRKQHQKTFISKNLK